MPIIGPGVDPATGEFLIAPRFFSGYGLGSNGSTSAGWKHDNPGCCCDVCPSYVCAHVRDCGGTNIAGATVSVTGPGGFTASGTTDSYGNWCAEAGGTGSYSVTASHGGISETKTVVVGTVCTTYEASFCLGGGNLCTLVLGCYAQTKTGIDVTYYQGGVLKGTATTATDSYFGALACLCVPPGVATTVKVESPPSRYAAGEVIVPAIRVQACRTSKPAPLGFGPTITLAPASGYHCLPCLCGTTPDWKEPAADTLYVSGLYGGGSHAMVYGPTGAFLWYGSYTVAYPGCTDAYGVVLCPPGTLQVEFGIPVSTDGLCHFQVIYTLLAYDVTGYPYCTIRTPMGGAPAGENVAFGGSYATITWSSCPPTTAGTSTCSGPLLPPSCTPVDNTLPVTITE